ncbi:ABC transporter substrate-binding protein [Propylenella binzhouense]|uniref:ABC transporter substrate-binding protein n=1 Tax=Propylenella binzhouense TaxID=2555902 RepID=A0A964T389_9HYPH|nr:ABC transporter substrate-binding protein [Propylenella binzhouense]MYZ47484.1 ABC transporter substrate-binding protein [Propylenella binzhouense]
MKPIDLFDDHKRWLERREFLKMGGLGVMGMMLAVATTNGASAQDKTPSIKNIKANLKKVVYGDFNPNYVNKWPVVIAMTLGYMKESGIDDVEIILSDQYIPGMVGGSLDITHGDTSVFLGSAQASGLPIKIISMFRDKEYWIMGVRKGIEKPEDLKGAKISGGALDGRNTWVQKQILKKMGLDPEKDVTFVPTSGASDNRMAALINGTLDAASVFPRHKKGIEESGGKFLFEELTSAPQEAFGAMGPWVEKNEDTVYAWTLADLKARQWLFDPKNKDQAYKIMRDYGYDIPPAFEEQYKVELDQLSPDGGFESAEVMDTFLAQLAETGGVPKDVDWRKVVDMKYVWAAQEALGLPKRPASI